MPTTTILIITTAFLAYVFFVLDFEDDRRKSMVWCILFLVGMIVSAIVSAMEERIQENERRIQEHIEAGRKEYYHPNPNSPETKVRWTIPEWNENDE